MPDQNDRLARMSELRLAIGAFNAAFEQHKMAAADHTTALLHARRFF